MRQGTFWYARSSGDLGGTEVRRQPAAAGGLGSECDRMSFDCQSRGMSLSIVRGGKSFCVPPLSFMMLLRACSYVTNQIQRHSCGFCMDISTSTPTASDDYFTARHNGFPVIKNHVRHSEVRQIRNGPFKGLSERKPG